MAVKKPKQTVASNMFGYARVSTEDQKLTAQIAALEAAGVPRENIYSDKKSGKNANRAGLQDVLNLMRPGDVLVVAAYDRLSRNVRDLINTLDWFHDQKIELRSLREQMDTRTAVGRFFFLIVASFAELERGLIGERTSKGMQSAKATEGRRYGPEPLLDEAKLKQAIKWLRPRKDDKKAVGEIAKKFGVSTTTLRNRVLEKHGKRLWPKGPRARD